MPPQDEDSKIDAAIDAANQDGDAAPAARAEGLPPVSPDVVEQEAGDDMDNIVPTRGYTLTPTVGLGGSAGSIQALTEFFAAMPADSGMVFVVVLHLSPEHDSALSDLLGRHTAMPVVQAEDNMKVRANHVYVIPPGKHLASVDGHLRLSPLEPARGRRMAVDVFFRTLADTHGAHAAAIVFSGGDGDGAIGLKRIKERGGLTVAQDPDEAEHEGMPRSAIDTGMVDWVLKAKEMPARLAEYFAREKRLYLPPESQPDSAIMLDLDGPDAQEATLREVIAFLHARTGRDFSYYKRATVLRRISRRMQINGAVSLGQYLTFLRTHPGEAGALLQDMLISVTNFFRDRDAFGALETYITHLFRGKQPSETVRVWVPACATGEEAYSVAMLLSEHARKLKAPPQVQVFATDLSEEVIQLARDGIYPAAITTDVSEERLARFFVKEHRGYRVRRELRETVLFAQHDLLKDSPFSKVDLITCRNLLIYLERTAQRRALDIFHFSLVRHGTLFLGTSESVDDASELFSPLDKKYRLYTAQPVARTSLPVPTGIGTLARALQEREHSAERPIVAVAAATGAEAPAWPQAESSAGEQGAANETYLRALAQAGPAVLIVNAQHNIVHLSAAAGRYLQFGGGEVTRNVFQVVHPALRVELRAALYRTTQIQGAVEVTGVPVEIEDRPLLVDLRVTPARDAAPELLVVSITPHAAAVAPADAPVRPQGINPATEQLESELDRLRRHLRDMQEQHEITLEEHKAGHEELQAINEELRSASEELETSREELQSINEELTTVNSELKARVDELGRANGDMHNLMAATNIATVFLDRELRITRYTPSAVALFKLIPTDVGRPLDDIKHRLEYPELDEDIRQVLAQLTPMEREVGKVGDGWFLARMQPYRSLEDRIEGVVVTFVDITARKLAEDAFRESETQFRSFVEVSSDTVYKMNADWTVMRQLEGKEFLVTTLDPTRTWLQTYIPPDERPRVRQAIQIAIRDKAPFELEHRIFRVDDTVGWTHSRAVPILNEQGEIKEWLGTASDVTERRRTQEAVRTSEGKYRTLFESIDEGFCVIEMILDDAGHAVDYRFLETNPAFERQSGLHRAAGKRAREIAPDLEEHWFEAYGRVVLTGRPERFENVAVALGKWFNVYAWRYGAPEERRVAILFRDETERREAAERLRLSEERYRLIFESAQAIAIFTLDSGGHITSWNPGAQNILGWTAAEIVGQEVYRLMPPEQKEAQAMQRQQELATRDGRHECDEWFVRQDGSRFWGSGVLSPLLGNGQVTGFLKIMRDASEELQAREAQEEVAQARANLLEIEQAARQTAEEANEAKDQFLAVLSHELRTPLMPINMALAALERRPDIPEAVSKVHEMIKRNVALEASFIDDLLDVTRIARGKMEIVRAPMDLHEAVRRAVEVSTPDLEAKRQPLTVSLEATTHTLSGDFARLQQVFWNLLKNASKFTSEGGAIALRTRDEADGQVVLEVTDTGIGMEAEAIERIFRPFEQASVSITREFGGLGLGLAIAKATVEAHGGTMRASSLGAGQGSTFTVVLPLMVHGETT